jgi:nucleoside-diphosphate-sugar epimerase
MKVALTGATGFIGSHVLTDLYKHGHDVTALVRNDDQADIVAARGATPTVVDLYDRAAVVASWVMRTERSTQPVLVTPPAPTRLRSCRRTIDAYAGTGKPFIESAVCGSTVPTPPSPRSRRSGRLRWWHGRNRSNAECLRSTTGAGSWSSPASRTASGGGMPGLLLGSPRDDQGNLIMLGTGQQHWSTVHVADLADFFRRALEHDAAAATTLSAMD